MGIRVPKKAADTYQHGNLRHALIQAGLRLLSEGGVHTLSLRAAAHLAGVSHAAPYRHFADKEALVAAIAEEGFVLFASRLRASVAPMGGASVIQRLHEMAAAYVSFAQEHPDYVRVMFGGVVDKARMPPSLLAAGQAAYGVLRALVEEGLVSGALRGGDVDQVALSCWSLVHGFSMLIVERTLPPPLDEAGPAAKTLEALVTLLVQGITHRPEGPTP